LVVSAAAGRVGEEVRQSGGEEKPAERSPGGFRAAFVWFPVREAVARPFERPGKSHHRGWTQSRAGRKPERGKPGIARSDMLPSENLVGGHLQADIRRSLPGIPF